MAAEQIFQLEFTYRDTPSKISIEAEVKPDNTGGVKAVFLDVNTNETLTVDFVVNLEQRNVLPMITMSGSSIARSVCITSCLITSVVGPFLDCCAQSTTAQDFIDCLKGKGVAVGASIFVCLLNCWD